MVLLLDDHLAVAGLDIGVVGWEQAYALRCRARPQRVEVFGEDPRGAAELDLGQPVGEQTPPGIGVAGPDSQPGGEIGAGRRPVAVQVAAEQFRARRLRVGVRDRLAEPLGGQDERGPVPGARGEADDASQGEDADAEMNDGLAERLPRGVRTFFLPDVALLQRQPAGDPPSELRAEFVDGEPAPGQDIADLGLGQCDRLGQAHAESVHRRSRSEEEVPHRGLGGREYSGGEHGGVRGRDVERCTAHAPGLHQAPVVGDRLVHSLPGDVAHPGV
ncbi:hypothetical protein SDC9_65230 [bioreactor metagenome]|uniref:Uncharacterized protein n=1 Tax=bioreactor metagenome TaxID=1076179 RepID=A0A644XXN6_9ZZZZ